MKGIMRQKLFAIVAALKRVSSRIYYRYSCFQGYCPRIDEINNNKIKSLASRLKADSYKETLTNILEWQNRNIEFWTERHPIVTLLPYACFICALAFGIGLVILLFIIIHNIELLWLLPWYIIICLVKLVSIIVTTLVIIILILRSNRKFPWTKILSTLKNIFVPSISVDFLLENKLGVCRDYAKLTACLLLNIYPKAEIYFAKAPYHVATGINIKNKLYMLDQRLPILTIDRWIDYRKHRKSDKIERFDPVNRILQKVNKRTFLQAKNRAEVDTEKLARKMMALLNIKERVNDKAISVKILWKNGAVLYEEDEFVDYSLARWLKMKISSELIKINQITKIEISRQENDLMFLINFNRTRS